MIQSGLTVNRNVAFVRSPMRRSPIIVLLALSLSGCLFFRQAPLPTSSDTRNTLGMRLVRIEPGSFMMGQAAGGEPDERPVRQVTIGKPYYMATTEVTNAQYEQFAPAHRDQRGLRGFSKGDDEAVIGVSWHEAVAFCRWLSKKERLPYRLPSEAEWEYACRAGTTTPYATGDTLPKPFLKAQEQTPQPRLVSLRVAETPPNRWGLCDMHGNVEEWCQDWYGPYTVQFQIDPVGYATGDFKVTRGGSHNTPVQFLRSANRQGTLPEDKHWLIGFRVVMGEPPAGVPLPPPAAKRWASDVTPGAIRWPKPAEMAAKPRFEGPVPFVRHPLNPETVPFYSHNHCPSLTWCPNGDLLAIWFSTPSESDRAMTILASRLRAHRIEWDEPSEFFKAPDRNMTGSALLNDGEGTLYHFNGLEAAGTWANLAMVMRSSKDSGASWSQPRLVSPEHGTRNQVISGTLLTREGFIIQPADASPGASGGTAIHVSTDLGQTWIDPGQGRPTPLFEHGRSGAWIAGIHAGLVQLSDSRLLALGRSNNIGGFMPMSLSRDYGKTWSYVASEFPPISGGQRLVLTRLREGPLLLVSFTDAKDEMRKPKGMMLCDAAGRNRTGFGMFAALSFDEGRSWPVRRLVSAGGPPRRLEGGAWTGEFVMDDTHAEPMGYLAATQTPDGMIHLVSSALYYRFNLAWLRQKGM